MKRKVPTIRKDLFLQVGRKYVVATHPEQGTRFDGTRGAYHYFTKGDVVECLRVYDKNSPEAQMYHKVPTGMFRNERGEEQDLFVMDVRAYHG